MAKLTIAKIITLKLMKLAFSLRIVFDLWHNQVNDYTLLFAILLVGVIVEDVWKVGIAYE